MSGQIKSYIVQYHGDPNIYREFQAISIMFKQLQRAVNGIAVSNEIVLGAGDGITLTTADNLRKIRITAGYDPNGDLILVYTPITVT